MTQRQLKSGFILHGVGSGPDWRKSDAQVHASTSLAVYNHQARVAGHGWLDDLSLADNRHVAASIDRNAA